MRRKYGSWIQSSQSTGKPLNIAHVFDKLWHVGLAKNYKTIILHFQERHLFTATSKIEIIIVASDKYDREFHNKRLH